MVHLGDPLEDLAWCTSSLWRAGGRRTRRGFSRRRTSPPRTPRASRPRRRPGALHFYDVLAIVKMIAIMLTGIRAFRDGRTHDLRMAIFDHQLPFLL